MIVPAKFTIIILAAIAMLSRLLCAQEATRGTASTLKVSGAQIYYLVRGSGPLLLILQGGAGDADTASRFVDELSNSYTVVTYDRRGQSRSKIDDPSQKLEMATLSEDAARLIAALSSEPAYVFGSSIGALIGLDLVARHPELVRKLIAHEPPARYLLNLPATGAGGGLLAGGDTAEALKRFAAGIGVDQAGLVGSQSAAAENNRRFFLRHEAPIVPRYRLNEVALRTVQNKIVLAGGAEGKEYWPYQSAAGVAKLLGAKFVELPGTHAGYAVHPVEFAAQLRELFN